MKNLVRLLMAVGTAGATLPTHSAFLTLDLSGSVNSRMQTYAGAASGYPEGDVTLGGVPFAIPAGGDNVWNASVAGGSNPRTLSVAVGVFGVEKVHTLINTWWGETGPGTLASIRFLGTGGLDHTVALDGNSDIRDFLDSSFSNAINGTTTTEVFSAGAGRGNAVRLDKQTFALPATFQLETLLAIELIDAGADQVQRMFLAGATVETATVIPEPGTWGMLAALGLVGFGLSRRLRAAGVAPAVGPRS